MRKVVLYQLLSLDGVAEEHVADLKQRPGRAIGIHGSIELARSLLGARLVDELRLVIARSIAGRGRRRPIAWRGLLLHYRVPT